MRNTAGVEDRLPFVISGEKKNELANFKKEVIMEPFISGVGMRVFLRLPKIRLVAIHQN